MKMDKDFHFRLTSGSITKAALAVYAGSERHIQEIVRNSVNEATWRVRWSPHITGGKPWSDIGNGERKLPPWARGG